MLSGLPKRYDPRLVAGHQAGETLSIEMLERVLERLRRV